MPQIDALEGFYPLIGDEGDLENGGMFSGSHIANNVPHLDPTLGIQVTSSLMEKVESDTVYQRLLEEVGTRSKRGLRELPRNHPAQLHKHMWNSLANFKLPNGKNEVESDKGGFNISLIRVEDKKQELSGSHCTPRICCH